MDERTVMDDLKDMLKDIDQIRKKLKTNRLETINLLTLYELKCIHTHIDKGDAA